MGIASNAVLDPLDRYEINRRGPYGIQVSCSLFILLMFELEEVMSPERSREGSSEVPVLLTGSVI